jgi:hypothetical protein
MHPKNKFERCGGFVLVLVCVVFLLCHQSLGQQSDPNQPLPEAPKANVEKKQGLFARWAEFYHEDWRPRVSPPTLSPAPERRGLPSPLDSPPFPNSDWSYGGSPVIGEPDSNSYPLMTAINQAKSHAKLYGWLDPTLNLAHLRKATRLRRTTCIPIVLS